MASIRERIDASGKKSYHVQIRLKGFPPQTQTFDNKSIAKQWAQRVETELREGRYMPHAVDWPLQPGGHHTGDHRQVPG